MEPIVSPWLIYLLFKVNDVIAITYTLAFFIFMVFAITWMAAFTNGDIVDSLIISTKKAAIAIGILLVFSIICPDKNTIIAMYTAKNITPQNIEKAVKAGAEVKEMVKSDVIEIIQNVVTNLDKIEENIK